MDKLRQTNPIAWLAICAALLLGGCATGSGDRLPEWVLAPPSDTQALIYGVGEGHSLGNARDNALAVIAGKLETRVTADVQSETLLQNGREQSMTRNRVRTTTEALKLSDYQTEKSDEVRGRRYVLVSVDRSALVASMLHDLDSLTNEIEGRLSGMDASSRLKQLYRLTLSRPVLIEAIDKIALAQSASQQPTLKQARMDRYQGLLTDRERLQQSLRMSVRWDPDTAEIGERVLTLLLELGLHAEPQQAGTTYDGHIEVAGQQSRREMFGEKHVQLSAEVTLRDKDGTGISVARYKTGASSLTNYESARQSANRLIAEEMSERGIWQALNMHEGV